MGISNNNGPPSRTRTNWTPPMGRYFLEIMVDQLQKGNKVEKTFSRHEWRDMTNMMNAKFQCALETENLKNRMKTLRRQWQAMKDILDQPGFRWDPVQKKVVAEEHVWDAHLHSHPTARNYKDCPQPDWNGLSLIFGNTMADGSSSSIGPSSNQNHIDVKPIEDMVGMHVSPLQTNQAASPNVAKDSPHSDNDSSQSTSRKVRRSDGPSSLSRSKRPKANPTNSLAEAIERMGDKLENGFLHMRKVRESEEQRNFREAVSAIEEVISPNAPNYIAAIELLEDPRKARTFFTLSQEGRLQWLRVKFGGQFGGQ